MQPGQMPCPSCETVIPLPVELIIKGEAITCAGCGLELRVDTGSSQQAVDALARWYEETRDAREQAAEAQASAKPRPGRRPRR